MNRFFTLPSPMQSFSNADNGYAVDYTNQTSGKNGVVLSNIQPSNIDMFQLSNAGMVEFWGVNFEQCPSLFTVGNIKKKNCECMFVAKQAKKMWACLVELKYCHDVEKNIKKNARKALLQLKSTLDVLLGMNILNRNSFNIYLNISIPSSSKVPFHSFILSPDKIKKMKTKHGFVLYGHNELKIINSSILVPVK